MDITTASHAFITFMLGITNWLIAQNNRNRRDELAEIERELETIRRSVADIRMKLGIPEPGSEPASQ